MMIENSKLGYGKHVLDEFEFETGRILHDVKVEYLTRGTPKYDEDGNISNAIIFCHEFNGNCTSIGDLDQIIGTENEPSNLNFFYISITSLGYHESCSPSTTNLKLDFPEYSIKDCVNFKRKFLTDVFGINRILGIIGFGLGGYEAYTWACEYPDEMEFLIVANSSYKTNGYRYTVSKAINNIIDTSDDYFDKIYSEQISKIMISIYSIIYSQYLPKKVFQNFTPDEIDLFMDDFLEDGLSVDIYDFKYRNDAILRYNVEDKLSDITAKTLVVGTSEDLYYSPEFDIYPLEEKIENIETHVFNTQNLTFKQDYDKFENIFKKFLEEFNK